MRYVIHFQTASESGPQKAVIEAADVRRAILMVKMKMSPERIISVIDSNGSRYDGSGEALTNLN